MDISQFTIEDFVYDPEFRKWVLYADFDSINLWEGILLENPSQRSCIMQAREILLRMVSGKDEMSETEFDEIWGNIESAGIQEFERSKKGESKIIPINYFVKVQEKSEKKPIYWEVPQLYRIAAILVISFGLGILLTTFFNATLLPVEPDPIVYEEHHTLPGIKSNLTLSDGSNIILNSGSSIRYVKGFDKDKREVFLDGEAYFNVFKDPDRPFTVRKANVSITALGTSFNVKAYDNEDLSISLISGQVGIDLVNGRQQRVLLEKGQSLRIKPKAGTFIKGLFNEEEVAGWTKKMIVFNKTPVPEVIRVLENWYGITVQLENEPSPGLLLSGRFENETLQKVLEGLSYTIKLEFTINNEVVNIRFLKNN